MSEAISGAARGGPPSAADALLHVCARALLRVPLLLAILGAPSQDIVAQEAAPPRPAPPGPHVRKTEPAAPVRSSFRRDEPIVGTYYFYWYDVNTGEHFIDGDGTDALTDHPAEPKGYSYRSVDWHQREILDVLDAGLDFILPVYWGFPGDYRSWSFVGIPPLVEALRRIEGSGKRPPRIGLFYDTSTLQWNSRGFHADLTTREGREWLYVSARDFFSLIPQDLRAAIDGRPIIWLYSAGFAKRQDPAALDWLRAEFAKDFGVEPFVVKEVSWQGKADATYAWGAALKPTALSVAAVGPGYDHSAVPGRSPLVRDRERGAFYSRSWEWLLSKDPARRPRIAVVETWNELHEGTDIAPSREYGRTYVDLTRKYTRLWKSGERLERTGLHGKAREVEVRLGEKNTAAGVAHSEAEDGKTAPARAAGREGRRTVSTAHGGAYIYFDVDDAFFFDDGEPLEVEVEYCDEAPGALVLEYDSKDPAAYLDGAFKSAAPVATDGSKTWKTATWTLDDPAFAGRANGYDFRLSGPPGQLVVGKVAVRKRSGTRR